DVGSDVEPSPDDSDDVIQMEKTEIKGDESTQESVPVPAKAPSIRTQKNHPKDLIIGDPDQGIATRRKIDAISNSCFVSKFEPKNVKEALTDEF
ncbi:gag-pol polyprotein, partial [Trifolium pratense]